MCSVSVPEHLCRLTVSHCQRHLHWLELPWAAVPQPWTAGRFMISVSAQVGTVLGQHLVLMSCSIFMWMRTEGILILWWTRSSFPWELLFQFFLLITENEVRFRFHLNTDWHWPVITCYSCCLSESVPSCVLFRSRHWRNGVYSRWNGQYWKRQWCWRPLQFAKRFERRRLHTFPQTECQALIVPEFLAQLRTIWLKHLYEYSRGVNCHSSRKPQPQYSDMEVS